MKNTTSNIPKIIHYCWFGENKKPPIVEACIKSWKENLIGYEIKEWNEKNFDIKSNEFVKEAYKSGKFAFVSDFVRVYVLYNYGGIYLDTDVEVFKSFDDLLTNESFWGFEEKDYIATSTIGCKQGNKLIKRFLDVYNTEKFNKNKLTTNVIIMSNILKDLGVDLNGEYQKFENLATFYPQEYFSPYDYINCYSKKTDNTYAMHHFYKSWLPLSMRIKVKVKKYLVGIIGGKNMVKIRTLVSK